MFKLPVKLLDFLASAMKALPYILVGAIILFVLFQLKSCGVFGPSKDTLTEVVKSKDIVITQVETANKGLVIAVDQAVQSGEATVVAVTEVAKKEKTIAKKQVVREAKVVSDTKVITDSFKEKPQTPETEREKEIQNSTVEINAIWDAFEEASNINKVTS